MRALALGLRRARRHPALVGIVYLTSLLPALALTAAAAPGLGGALDRSPFAAAVERGWEDAVVGDLVRSGNYPGVGDAAGVLPALLLVLGWQVLLAAGTVEVLFERSRPGDHPFLVGVGRHGPRFARSAVWFAVAVALLALALSRLGGLGLAAAAEARDGRLALGVVGAVGLLGFVAFAPLDLAYDLSRIAAAGTGGRRTLVGFVRALKHVLARPGLFAPLYLSFALLVLGLHLGWAAATAPWRPVGLGQVVLLILGQQAVMLLRAALQVAFWGAEVAYFVGIGEPRWCSR